MAGVTTLEGQDYISEVLYSKGTTPQTLVLGLFVDVAGVLVEASTWASVNQASGGGYAEKSLTDGSWTIVSGGIATYPAQSWTGTEDWALPVYGYYIRTDEGSPRLLHFEYSPAGLKAMANGDIYTVDLSSNTESI